MRVLVVSDKSMYGEGLCALLAQRAEFEVVRQAADVPKTEVSARIERYRPDVLIMECSDEESDPPPALVRCLRNGQVWKIITVNCRDNVICIFTGERRTVMKVADLMEAITGDTQGT